MHKKKDGDSLILRGVNWNLSKRSIFIIYSTVQSYDSFLFLNICCIKGRYYGLNLNVTVIQQNYFTYNKTLEQLLHL